MKFRHLQFVKQTYIEHFKDAISYSWTSLKSSFYFLVHACWPDSFEFDGSDTIDKLDKRLKNKKIEIMNKNSILLTKLN